MNIIFVYAFYNTFNNVCSTKESPHRGLMLSRSELPNYKYADFVHKGPKDNLPLLTPLYY